MEGVLRQKANCYYNQNMRIEFDPAKNLRNASERGLGLERAADFDFGTALVWQDTRKSYP